MTSAAADFPAKPRDIDLHRVLILVRSTALRSLKVRYRGSALGILWSFANPVIMTALYTIIFGTTFARYFDGSVTRYLVSAFVGLVVVTLFLNATSESLTTIVQNGLLLNKLAIPPAVFPLSAVAANLFQQACTTFPILLILSVAITHDPVRVMLVPVVLFGLCLLTIGVSLGLSALYVFFRDLSYIWGITGFVLWMTSPMFYPAAVAPDRVQIWFAINPVSQQLTAIREVTLAHGPIHGSGIAVAFITGVVAMVFGTALFSVTRRDFMDLL